MRHAQRFRLRIHRFNKRVNRWDNSAEACRAARFSDDINASSNIFCIISPFRRTRSKTPFISGVCRYRPSVFHPAANRASSTTTPSLIWLSRQSDAPQIRVVRIDHFTGAEINNHCAGRRQLVLRRRGLSPPFSPLKYLRGAKARTANIRASVFQE